jgi:peptidylprolyl isomerase
MTKLPSGTYYRDLTVGTGAEVVAKTDSVWVNYAGFLKDGKPFDSGTNIKFEPSRLIPGFGAGIAGMKVGGERLIVIPSDQGYGSATQREPSTGKILIPRQSTLVFRVTLLRLHDAA